MEDVFIGMWLDFLRDPTFRLDFNPFCGICVTATVKIQSGRPMPNISGLEIVLPPLHQVNYFQHSLTEVKGKDGNLDGLLLG